MPVVVEDPRALAALDHELLARDRGHVRERVPEAPWRVNLARRAPPAAASRTAPRAIAVVCQRQKPWIVPGDALERDRHAGALERRRVGLALVAQDVVAGGEDVRGRDARRGRARSGDASGWRPSAPFRYRLQKRRMAAAVSPKPLVELRVGRRVDARVGDRVDEQLELELLAQLRGRRPRRGCRPRSRRRRRVAVERAGGGERVVERRPGTGARARAGSRCSRRARAPRSPARGRRRRPSRGCPSPSRRRADRRPCRSRPRARTRARARPPRFVVAHARDLGPAPGELLGLGQCAARACSTGTSCAAGRRRPPSRRGWPAVRGRGSEAAPLAGSDGRGVAAVAVAGDPHRVGQPEHGEDRRRRPSSRSPRRPRTRPAPRRTRTSRPRRAPAARTSH